MGSTKQPQSYVAAEAQVQPDQISFRVSCRGSEVEAESLRRQREWQHGELANIHPQWNESRTSRTGSRGPSWCVDLAGSLMNNTL